MDTTSLNKHKELLIKNVIKDYVTKDVYGLVLRKLGEENFIEAFAIIDQYIEDAIAKLLVINKGELSKVRERINITHTLDLMKRLGLIDDLDFEYLELVKKFKKVRNMLIHNSINSKPVKKSKDLTSLPKKIIRWTDLFYLETSIKLMRMDQAIFYLKDESRKTAIKKWFEINDERLSCLLEFLLNLNFLHISKNRDIKKEEHITEFAAYLSTVFYQIFPTAEKTFVTKYNYKEFIDYTSKLIMRENQKERKVGV